MHTLLPRGLLLALVMMGLVACGGDAVAPNPSSTGAELPSPGEPEPTNDLATVPPPPEGVVEFWFPEQIIPAASEQQLCLYMEPLQQETYMAMFDAYQGSYGHHLLFFRAVVPAEPGTVKDCTDASGMATLIPAVFPQNFFGEAAMPDGMAVRIEAGTQLVLQSHYVNSTMTPLRVHDAIHVRTISAEEVQTQLGFYALTDIGFAAQPGKDSISFDCEVPHDMTLLMAGPHMHEWGDWMTVDAGPENAMSRIVDIQVWDSEYRDLPPVSNFVDKPFHLTKGDRVRVSCAWDNDLDEPLGFPKEMCALYGYFYPVVGSEDTWICTP